MCRCLRQPSRSPGQVLRPEGRKSPAGSPLRPPTTENRSLRAEDWLQKPTSGKQEKWRHPTTTAPVRPARMIRRRNGLAEHALSAGSASPPVICEFAPQCLLPVHCLRRLLFAIKSSCLNHLMIALVGDERRAVAPKQRASIGNL